MNRLRIALAIPVLLLPDGVVFAEDFAAEVIEATFKLFHPASTSTCFLVRRAEPDKAHYVVTTAHSLERIKGETAVLVLRERKSDGSHVRRDQTIAISSGKSPRWVRHPKEDVAVLRLDATLPVPVRALPLSALADEARLKAEELHSCSPVFVLTYPQRFEANGAGFPVARQGIIADYPFLPTPTHHRFLADFTTFAGDSGGPVFVRSREGRPLVIGMVLAQYRHDETVKMEYEERTIHHPLGLGMVLYPQLIRDTIEKAAQQTKAGVVPEIPG